MFFYIKLKRVLYLQSQASKDLVWAMTNLRYLKLIFKTLLAGFQFSRWENVKSKLSEWNTLKWFYTIKYITVSSSSYIALSQLDGLEYSRLSVKVCSITLIPIYLFNRNSLWKLYVSLNSVPIKIHEISELYLSKGNF